MTKIDIISEKNNMFRTLFAGCIILLITKLCLVFNFVEFIQKKFNVDVLIVVILTIICAYSYRKQTKYVAQRVRNANKNNQLRIFYNKQYKRNLTGQLRGDMINYQHSTVRSAKRKLIKKPIVPIDHRSPKYYIYFSPKRYYHTLDDLTIQNVCLLGIIGLL